MNRRVYIAGPYTKGDQALNVRSAIHAADRVLALGYAPYVPHLTHFWHLLSPKDYETWLRLDFAWLELRECMVRLPGESAGADREERHARSLGIIVFNGVDDFAEWMGEAQAQ